MKNKLLHIALLGLLLVPAFRARAGITALETAQQQTDTIARATISIVDARPTETADGTAAPVSETRHEDKGAPIEVETEIEAVTIDALQDAVQENSAAAEEPAPVGTASEPEVRFGEDGSTAGTASEPAEVLRESDAAASSVAVSPRGMRLKKRFLPTSRRIDREINKNRFVFKGETMFGLTVSYGTLSTEDADMFPIFENIDLRGNITTVNPFVGYFYRDNRCFGVRFGYTHISGRLNSLGINLGEQNDIELEIPWLDLTNDRYSFGLFHRTYVPIDEKGRFAVFGEIELSMATGENTFAYKSGDNSKRTSSKNTTVKAWVNPGVAVYAFPNVCASISFGLGGFKYTHIRQYDDQGIKTGERHYSKMNLRLNIADIRIGVTVHLWNKKKGDRT